MYKGRDNAQMLYTRENRLHWLHKQREASVATKLHEGSACREVAQQRGEAIVQGRGGRAAVLSAAHRRPRALYSSVGRVNHCQGKPIVRRSDSGVLKDAQSLEPDGEGVPPAEHKRVEVARRVEQVAADVGAVLEAHVGHEALAAVPAQRAPKRSGPTAILLR